MKKKILLSSQENTDSVSSTNTVIVTGATGFVGQHLVPLFLQNKYNFPISKSSETSKKNKLIYFNNINIASKKN